MEKDMPKVTARFLMDLKRPCRRQMFPQEENEATVRAKSSTYESIRPCGILK